MSSIASDPSDYYMGYYDCNDGVYGCEDDGDYGGYDDSHDQEPNGNESYYSRGEYEKNGDHSYYGEDGEDDKPCDGSYDDNGACERSYSHSESENCSYDGDGTYYTSHSKDEGEDIETKADMEDVLGVSVPKGLVFQILKKSVISRHILIGSELNGNANPLTLGELKWLMRFKYVPKGYRKLYNVDPRRQVLKIQVDIYGALGFDIVLDDWCNRNYITPSTVAYLRLPQISRHYPYTMEGCKVTEDVKVSFTRGEYYEEGWCDVIPMYFCHLCLGAN
ncbi:hypothetical protein KY290_025091 [Solanum tuberosum]|uniref:Uncharacterized protein n=1 Tax=Solanum tuberosum TaxID=4113 RepID=A0ABQ7UUK9_SOLTU|nr:hypothetical protein KY284_023940 [Solanum tuberosum]KAH0754821.1 hypothetical protein KY290_025091 [Solanum tuberosum]